MFPTTGGPGLAGGELIVTSGDACETQPAEFVTVNEYVPGGRLVKVAEVPEPVIVRLPGDEVIVQFPDAGRPLN